MEAIDRPDEPPRERERRRFAEARIREFKERALNYVFDENTKAELEKILESQEKCLKCQGHVRATIADMHEARSMAWDCEILVRLYCPVAGCGWAANQWRPWRKGAPREI